MSKPVRVYFEDFLSATGTLSYFSVNIYAPKADDDSVYILLGTGGGPATVKSMYKEGDYWRLSGYAELQSMNDSFAYEYVLFAPDVSPSHPKKYLGVPYAYMPLKTVDGTQLYDVQPAFTDWELNPTTEEE